MGKINKTIKANKYSLFNNSLKSLDGSVEELTASDIIYIGRGEYWIRKKGVVRLSEIAS